MGESKIRINFTLTEEGDGDLYYVIADLPKRLQARKLRSFALAGLYANRFAGQPREIIHRDHRPQGGSPGSAQQDATPKVDPAPVEPEAAQQTPPIIESASMKSATAETQIFPASSPSKGDAFSMIDTSVMD